jgi:DNA polymerase III delta prime subunit
MIVTHPHTQRMMKAFSASDAHAVIITGQEGVGLTTIATEIASNGSAVTMTVLPEKDEKVDIEKGTITIQSIRRLYDLTKTVEPNGRVIIIDYAERMGIPAQNAFLKLLEEPVAGTRFVLLTHQLETLLPTIVSRSQLITVKPVSDDDSNALLTHLKVTDATKRAQLLFIASGRPAALTRLAADETIFATRAQIIKDARTFITGTSYDRLQLAHQYKSDRTAALTMLEDALKLLRRSLSDKGEQTTLEALTRLEVIHKRLSEQGNVKLQLSSAVTL